MGVEIEQHPVAHPVTDALEEHQPVASDGLAVLADRDTSERARPTPGRRQPGNGKVHMIQRNTCVVCYQPLLDVQCGPSRLSGPTPRRRWGCSHANQTHSMPVVFGWTQASAYQIPRPAPRRAKRPLSVKVLRWHFTILRLVPVIFAASATVTQPCVRVMSNISKERRGSEASSIF